MERVLPPQNYKKLKRFLGMINFYRDVFNRRGHVLSPLNDLAAARAKSKKGEKKKPRIGFKMLKVHPDKTKMHHLVFFFSPFFYFAVTAAKSFNGDRI